MGVNVTENTITANADGTLISGAAATARNPDHNPDTDVDYANSAFKVSPAEYASLQTGQAFTYSSGDNGPIGGLTSGTLYYIILPSDLTDEIQLAATSHRPERHFIHVPAVSHADRRLDHGAGLSTSTRQMARSRSTPTLALPSES